MNLGRIEYGRVYSSLIGFGGSTVCPLGSVPLQVSLGTFPTRVIDTVLFLVVNQVFDYNVIFGRPALNQLRAISSPLNNRIKFPTPHGVGEKIGNIREAWECYIMSTRRASTPVLTVAKQPEQVLPAPLRPAKDEIGAGDGNVQIYISFAR